MQDKEYIFFLKYDNTRFWQIDVDDNLLLSTNPYILRKGPVGWEEIAIQNVRNDKYFGIDRSTTIPLSFVKDGAKILKLIFAKFGHEAKCFLTICQQDLKFVPGVNYAIEQDLIFKGQIDFTTYKHVGAKVSCEILEEGLTKYLKANEATAFEIPMNVPQAINVEMDGIKLRETFTFADTSDLEIARSFYGISYFGPVNLLGNDGDSNGVIALSEIIESTGGLSFSDRLLSENFIFRNDNNYPIDIRLKGILEFQCIDMISSPPYALRTRYLTSTQTTANQSLYDVFISPGMAIGQTYTHPFDIPITLQPGERLYRESIFVGGVGSEAKIIYTDNSKFDIFCVTLRPATFALHLPGQYIYDYLINKVTEGNYKTDVSKLLTLHNQILFTCGDAIRDIKDDNGVQNAVMKLSLLDYFRFWDYRFDCGLTEVRGLVTLERKIDLIDTTHFIDLGEPALTPSFYCNAAPIFNEYEYGYPDISNEVGVLNGRQEFNCRMLRSLGTMINPKKLSRISPIRASCYEMEKIRTRLLNKDTTDSNTDNYVYANVVQPYPGEQLIFESTEPFEITQSGTDTIVLTSLAFGQTLIIGDRIVIIGAGPFKIKALVPGSGIMNVYLFENTANTSPTTGVIGVYRTMPSLLDRSLNASVDSGLIEKESVWNLFLRPELQMQDCGAFIRSSLYKCETLTFNFINADKNSSIVMNGVADNRPVNIGSLAAPYIMPFYTDSVFPAPINLMANLDIYPLQVFRTSLDGNYYFWISKTISSGSSEKRQQNYTLISLASNNIENLVNYEG